MRPQSSQSEYDYAIGRKGLVQVELANIAGKTAIGKLRTRAPLLVQKALYPDSGLPGMAHVYLMSSAGGILEGDRMKIDIASGSHTLSRITTQAATKIYKMDKGHASQKIVISVGDECYLEFIPYQIIPFRSSRFFQEVDIRIGANSTMIYSETMTAGRTASGESFDFETCSLKMAARDFSGKVLFEDAAKLEPDKEALEDLFDHKTIWSTIYVITQDFEAISKQIDTEIRNQSILAAYSILPHDCGLVIRMLDNSIDKIRHLTDVVTEVARRRLHPIQEQTN